jgi:hypothetical protein
VTVAPEPAVKFVTREESAAREQNSPLPYFRLEDSLCRRFLKQASNPREFEGLKLLFPFVRESSVLRAPQEAELLRVWMELAFYAGHDLGRAHPELLEDVVPPDELRDATYRIGMLQKFSEERCLNHCGMQRACSGIAAALLKDEPKEQVEAIFLRTIVNTLRAGFAGGTIARVDPTTSEFVGDLPPRVGKEIWNIVERVTIGAPLDAVGRPVAELLEHPLIRLAREKYPAEPLQCDAVLAFLRGRLSELGVTSENECPASELDLLDWIAAAMEYGRRLQVEQPDVVERILEEAPGESVGNCTRLVRRVVREAGGTEPLQLLGPLKAWQKRVYEWCEPGFYGQELAQIVYFADFAIWIPWAMAC